MAIRYLLLCLLLLNLPGCGYWQYVNTDYGEFKGKLQVRWIEPDKFLFLPDSDDPFRYIGKNRTIQPKAMYTDGGSIPQLFWSVPGYSPWGYAQAYIIHDWIFVAHHCNDGDDGDFTFDDSATILSEGIKTMMERKKVPKSYFTHYTISQSVKSKIARNLWDSATYIDEGKCNVEFEKIFSGLAPVIITVIDANETDKP